MSFHLWLLRGRLHNFYYIGMQIGMNLVNHECMTYVVLARFVHRTSKQQRSMPPVSGHSCYVHYNSWEPERYKNHSIYLGQHHTEMID